MKKYLLILFILILNFSIVNAFNSISDTVLEGNTRTYTIAGANYVVTLDFVDKNSAKFTINGKGTENILEGKTYELDESIKIEISNILFQDYAGGVHSVSFNLIVEEAICGDNKCSLEETCYEDNCCDGIAVNFNTEDKHCGTCGNACEEDYACEQGICEFNIKDDLAYYPKFLIKANHLDVAIVVGDKAPSTHVLGQTQIALSLSNYIIRRTGTPGEELAKLASEIDDIENFNIISIGNACVNEVSAEILGNPKPCNNLKPGEATIEIYRSEGNKAQIVLNAYSDEGVKKSADVLSNYIRYNFNGNKVVLEVEELAEKILEDKSIQDEYGKEEETTEELIEEEEEIEVVGIDEKNQGEIKEIKNETVQKDTILKPTEENKNIFQIIVGWFLGLFK